MIPIRKYALLCLLFTSCLAGFAQSSSSSKLSKVLSNVDLGVQGVGEFTKSVTGPVTIPADDQGTIITQTSSNTFGALGTLRYAPRPYLGAEFNGSYIRYTEGFNVPPYQIQTQANEFTFGYLVTPPYTIFGTKPYASVGGGLIRFAPTRGGGEGAPSEGRGAVYYNLGVQHDFYANFGVRVGFRQVFYTAPDYFQNYLTINKRTLTSEPVIGFYLRF